MAWESLKSAIAAVITSNANNEITGAVLRGLLNNTVVPQLGALQYKGLATTTTNPGTPSGVAFYLAKESGTYTFFGGIVLQDEVALLRYDGAAWNKDVILYIRGLSDGGDGTGNFINEFSAGYSGGLSYKPYADWNFGTTNFTATGDITLDPADVQFGRVDLIVLNSNGAISKITGVPSANPVEPDYDPTTQLKAAFILVEAGATEPGGLIENPIYTENLGVAGGEWDAAIDSGGARWNLAATEPHLGTYAIKGTQLQGGDAVGLTPAQPIPIAEITEISFWIKNLVAVPINLITLYYTGGLQSRRQVYENTHIINLKYHGYNSQNTTDWQFISITLDTTFLDIRKFAFHCSTEPSVERPTILIDDFKYNNGSISEPTGGNYATLGYVDRRDAEILEEAKAYADSLVVGGNDQVTDSYPTMADLYADQANQLDGDLFIVVDASAHSTVDSGWAFFEFLGSLNAGEIDYRKLSEQESLDVVNPPDEVTQVEFDALETRVAKLERGAEIVSTSRVLSAADSGKKLLITAPITLTWPSGGISGFECNFDVDAAGQLTIADQAATAGNDLDAANGTVLAAGKMGHAYKRPDNIKLRLKGDFTL